MTLSVLLFASYADLLGRSTIELTVEPGATVADVVSAVRKIADDERLPAAPLVAVNEVYARADQLVLPGDEVAIIPPVAGG